MKHSSSENLKLSVTNSRNSEFVHLFSKALSVIN